MSAETVDKVASIIFWNLLDRPGPYDPPVEESAARINAGPGWTLQYSALWGGLTIIEGVQLNPVELAAAIKMAKEWGH